MIINGIANNARTQPEENRGIHHAEKELLALDHVIAHTSVPTIKAIKNVLPMRPAVIPGTIMLQNALLSAYMVAIMNQVKLNPATIRATINSAQKNFVFIRFLF